METAREQQVRRALEEMEFEDGARQRQVQRAVAEADFLDELGEHAWAAVALVDAQRRAAATPESWRRQAVSTRKVAARCDRPIPHIEGALTVLWQQGLVAVDHRAGGKLWWWAAQWEWDPI